MNINKLNFADEAEKVIKNLKEYYRKNKNERRLSTSKIRNILAMTNTLYNETLAIKDKKLTDDIIHDVQYLKMRIAYEAGRETSVKVFVNKAGLMEYLDTVGDSRDRLILYCNYMEALVAYHKFHGGE